MKAISKPDLAHLIRKPLWPQLKVFLPQLVRIGVLSTVQGGPFRFGLEKPHRIDILRAI